MLITDPVAAAPSHLIHSGHFKHNPLHTVIIEREEIIHVRCVSASASIIRYVFVPAHTLVLEKQLLVCIIELVTTTNECHWYY